MVCNGLVRAAAAAPARLEAERPAARTWRGAAARHPPRRHLRHRPAAAICSIALLGQTQALASIGLVSFAAIAQFAPAFFGGLVWRNGTARGAIAGIVVGLRASGPTRCCCRGSSRPAGCRAAVLDGRPVRPGLPVAAGAVLPAVRAADARRAVEHRRQRAGVRHRLAAARARADRAPAGADLRARRPAARRRCRRRSGCGARRSRSATCSRRSRAISAPSAPSARSPSMPPAASAPLVAARRKPTSSCCASPSIC